MGSFSENEPIWRGCGAGDAADGRRHFGSVENVCGNLRFGVKAFILLSVG